MPSAGTQTRSIYSLGIDLNIWMLNDSVGDPDDNQ